MSYNSVWYLMQALKEIFFDVPNQILIVKKIKSLTDDMMNFFSAMHC